MKFISVRDLRTSPKQIWKSLRDERELVVTNNGRPIALLTPISDETLEDTVRALRRVRAMNAVQEMQLSSIRTGKDVPSEEEIEAEIVQTRKARRR